MNATTRNAADRVVSGLLPLVAGTASFLFSLAALLLLTEAGQKMFASVALGLFALLVCWVAAERPNSQTARANRALADRLLAVENGDLTSPAPALVREAMPAVAQAVNRLFAQVRESIEDARAVALQDPVTGLPNRVYFCREAERLLRERAPETLAAVMFVDLDRFKAINDNLGHARGDEALVIVADRLRAITRSGNSPGGGPAPLLARLAGDEFMLLLPRLDEAADIERVADAVLSSLSRPFEIGGHSVDVGASIGVARCPQDGTELAVLMRASDIAMYEAKSSGRGRVCVFDDALAEEFETRTTTAADLQTALVRNEFELYFQPQVTPGTGELISIEALLRWHHPRTGLRMPTTFIPIAEDCGLIMDVGEWVIDAVAETLARWRRAGITTRLALNVSPRQLDRAQFFGRLREAMTRAGADLAQLELEFTETATMALDAAVLAELAALRADGVLIAMDDFGTGYSNLARLKQLPLDRIKIDRTLVAEIDSSETARVIVQAIVQLVHGIGCLAVAEGVETAAQAEVLRLIGCDTLQGYALGEPMTDADLMDWMAPAPGLAQPSMRAITSA